jgi:hypothetical protein
VPRMRPLGGPGAGVGRLDVDRGHLHSGRRRSGQGEGLFGGRGGRVSDPGVSPRKARGDSDHEAELQGRAAQRRESCHTGTKQAQKSQKE